MKRIIDSLEENVRVQFLQSSKINRLSIWMVSVINQNLPIILVGVTLSFTVEYMLRFSEMNISEDNVQFILKGVTTLFWFLLSIVQVSYTVRFLILQNELPIGSVKNRDFNNNAAVSFLLQQRFSEVRHFSLLFVLSIFFLLFIALLVILQFLETNHWINLSRIINFFTEKKMYLPS